MSRSSTLIERAVAVVLGHLLAGGLPAQTLTLSAGTAVYGELDEQLSSKKKETAVGDIVRASVWRDVELNGQVVIEAGAPMVTRVSMVKPAKVAGRKGEVELEAVSVRAIDGSEVQLDGGYDKSGKGRKAMSWTLFALVAWPLVFIKGKQAVLQAGTVFDSAVQNDTRIRVTEPAPFPVRLGAVEPELEAEVLYDDMDPEAKQQRLPLKLRICKGTLSEAAAVTVNERQIEPIPLLLGARSEVDGCSEIAASLDLEALAKHFTRGINRFEIDAGGARTEIILEIEL